MTRPETPQEHEPSTSILAKLGPGLITGAADDDPSGIATYSQGGAQFGYSLLWTLFLTYPLMVGIQIISARIGRVTGRGLAGNMRRHYPRWLLFVLTGLLLIANTANIGADVNAMADALVLVIGGQRHLYIVGLGLICVLLQVLVAYQRYVRVLKWLTMSLFAYVAVVFFVQVPWLAVAREIVLPHLSLKSDYVTTVVAIFGTTISPYLFFWQASQEAQDVRAVKEDKPLRRAPLQAPAQSKRIVVDTLVGMGFSNVIALFIMMTAAATLHQHGMTDIQSSAQAAQALRPLAGDFAFVLFSLGIIGTGLLAVPVLAGSSAFALSETFGWRQGFNLSARRGAGFYGVIAVSTLVGAALGFTAIDPMKALFASAVVNGVISVPIMAIMMLMSANSKVMAEFVNGRWLTILGWSATGAMALTVSVMLIQFFL